MTPNPENVQPSASPAPAQPPAAPPRRGIRPTTVVALGCGGAMGLFGLLVLLLAVLGSPGSVHSGSVLKMTVKGPLVEVSRREGLEELFEPKVLTVRDHVDNLKKAAKDDRIKGVVLRIDDFEGGFAKIEELRDAMAEYKKSGKFLVAWAEVLDEKGYALALGADEIIMPPDAPFLLDGLAIDVQHFPGLLEKLGVEVQYFRYGKFKSASGEQLGRKEFSEPVKEMLEGNLELVFQHFVKSVADARKLSEDDVRAAVDSMVLRSDTAKEKKLIDRLAYWDELEAELRAKTGKKEDEELEWTTQRRYAEVSLDAAGVETGDDLIAVVNVAGLIVPGESGVDPFGGGQSQGSTSVIKALRRAEEDKDVKAIVLRVDSPGGAGLGADYIRREIERIKKKKPVVASMSDYAASGGYWVAMSCDAIVAHPTTATGSIGVFAVVPNLKGTYEKLDLNDETFKRGAHADALIGARPMTEDEAKTFDDSIHAFYTRFVELAAKGRGKSFDELQEVAQGRTWYGTEALEKGLVDELGGLDTAVALAQEKAKLTAGPARVENFDEARGFFEKLGQDPDDEAEGDLGALLLEQVVRASGARPLLKRAPLAGLVAREALAGRARLFAVAEVPQVR